MESRRPNSRSHAFISATRAVYSVGILKPITERGLKQDLLIQTSVMIMYILTSSGSVRSYSALCS